MRTPFSPACPVPEWVPVRRSGQGDARGPSRLGPAPPPHPFPSPRRDAPLRRQTTHRPSPDERRSGRGGVSSTASGSIRAGARPRPTLAALVDASAPRSPRPLARPGPDALRRGGVLAGPYGRSRAHPTPAGRDVELDDGDQFLWGTGREGEARGATGRRRGVGGVGGGATGEGPLTRRKMIKQESALTGGRTPPSPPLCGTHSLSVSGTASLFPLGSPSPHPRGPPPPPLPLSLPPPASPPPSSRPSSREGPTRDGTRRWPFGRSP